MIRHLTALLDAMVRPLDSAPKAEFLCDRAAAGRQQLPFASCHCMNPHRRMKQKCRAGPMHTASSLQFPLIAPSHVQGSTAPACMQAPKLARYMVNAPFPGSSAMSSGTNHPDQGRGMQPVGSSAGKFRKAALCFLKSCTQNCSGMCRLWTVLDFRDS